MTLPFCAKRLRRGSKLFAILFSTTIANAADKVTYDDHVLPIFQQSCLNCHNPDKAKGGLDLSTYQGTIKGGSGGKIVDAGDTSAKLLAVVLQTAEPKMPPEGDKISEASVTVLRQWIEGGLLENKGSTAKKATKPKFDAVAVNPTAKPDGPPPMPEDVLLEPVAVTEAPPVVQAMVTSPWAPLLAVTGRQQILLFRTPDLGLVGVLPFPTGDPQSLAFTPDGKLLIAGGGIAGKLGITVTYDVSRGSIVATAAKETDSVLAADIRPDRSAVATGSPSKRVKIWSPGDTEPKANIKKHTDWVTALDYSPDGVLLATGDRNGGVWVWESESAVEFHTLRAHQSAITSICFRTDSNLLGTASTDGTVRFWEMNGGSEVKKIDAHGGGVTAFQFAPRNGSFVTAGRDQKLKIWKPDFGQQREIGGLPGIPTAASLDAEGTYVFAATEDGTLRSWQVAEGKEIAKVTSNPPTIATRIADLEKQPNLAQELKFWQAAAVNTLALKEHARAELLASETDAEQSSFAEQARQIGELTQALSQKREEHARIMKAAQESSHSMEVRAELLAIAEALAAVVERKSETLAEASRSFLERKAAADKAASETHLARTRADQETERYQGMKHASATAAR